jgi:hypothetical protein
MKRTILIIKILLLSFYCNAQTPTFQSLLQNNSGTQANEIYNVAKDNNGNTFFCGTHTDALSFGGKSLPSGQGGAFWGKVDSSGNVLWLKQGGTASASDKAYGVAVDSNGNVYVCGAIANYQTASFNGTPLASTFGGFVVKYSNDGTFLWASGIGASVYSIAINNSGIPIINYGDQALYTLNPDTGEFNYSPSGSFNGNNQNPQWHNIVIDSGNNSIVQAGNKIVKFDSGFNQLWSTPVTGTLIETFRINLDESGNVFGTYYGLFGTVTVGTTPKSSFPNGYIYKLNSTNGTPLFVDVFLIGGNASKIKEVIPSGSDYYISGDGAFNTAVVLKTSTNYSLIWQKNLSNKSPLNDIALLSNDCLLLGGAFQGTVVLDSNTLTPPSGMDSSTNNSFMIKLCDSSGLGMGDIGQIEPLVLLYPNPSNGFFNVEVDSNLIGAKTTIYNLLGQKVKEFSLNTTITNQFLNKGMYLLEFEKNGNKTTKKLIVN